MDILNVFQLHLSKSKTWWSRIQGMGTNEDDFVEHLITTSTHDTLLFFTNKGKVYRIKGYEIPEYGRTAKGLPVVNLLEVDKG